MQTGQHALSWTLQRLGIALAMIVGLVVFAYVMLVTVVVVGQGAAGLVQ
jgi:hypothetical protein